MVRTVRTPRLVRFATARSDRPALRRLSTWRAARRLPKRPTDVLLVDQGNTILFQRRTKCIVRADQIVVLLGKRS